MLNSPEVEQITYPSFTHPEVRVLYKEDLLIDEDIIRNLLSLPQDTLLEDLHRLIYDTINRFDYFQNTCDTSEDEQEQLIHALFLLMEINSDKSRPVILDVLRQKEEYFDFWLGDFLTNGFWQLIYRFFYKEFNTLAQFVKEGNIYEFALTEVSVAVEQMALHNHDLIVPAVEWYKEIFEYFIQCDDQKIEIDTDLCGLFVSDAISLKDLSLKPLILEMFERGMVAYGVSGNFKTVSKIMEEAFEPLEKRELAKDIYERYDDAFSAFSNPLEEYDKVSDYDYEKDFRPLRYVTQQPAVRIEPKVGRNDPCPCGSGKKYKKCHGAG